MTDTINNNDPSFPRSRVKKQSNRVLYLFIITIAFLTGGFYFYQKNLQSVQDNSVSGIDTTIKEGDSTMISKDIISSTAENDTSIQVNNLATASQNGKSVLNVDSSESISSPASNIDTSSAVSTISGEMVQDLGAPSLNGDMNKSGYEKQIVELNNFYDHLDSQQYMQDFKLPEPSKKHFSKLIQKLIDNPPIVARETDDLFTLLKNTAHFFRIIGKDNILVLKGILDREKDSFESILQSLYSLTNSPELLKQEYSVSLDTDSLYDYACFFLNTMGGRLYLFRRDSNSRMAVSFYAIAIIDRANDTGNSRHGIDIRPGIDSLIEEIENGGKNLRMREYYLDTLYDLKVKYD